MKRKYLIFVLLLAFLKVNLGFAENEVYINKKNVTIKSKPYEHFFKIKKKLKNEIFWVTFTYLDRSYPVDNINYFHCGNIQALSKKDIPKNPKAIEMLKQMHTTGQIEFAIDGSKAVKEFQKVMNRDKNYYLIPMNPSIRAKIKQISVADTVVVSGYVLKLKGHNKYGKKYATCPMAMRTDHLLVEDIIIK